MDADADVVVVGAGPTGLLLAGDLARAGVRCIVLERRVEESNLTRAFAVHARSLEILDARGVADELVATGTPVDHVRLFGRLRVDLTLLPSRYPYVLVTPQYNTETVLAERATALGAQIVRGAEVVGVQQERGGVDVQVRHRDGSRSAYRTAYVVGADGVGSRVRQALGLGFPGHSAVQSVILADVRLEEAPPDVLVVDAARDGFAFLAPFGDGWYRVIAWNRRRQLPDTAPVELREIRQISRSVLGTDYGMHSPRWMSRFHSDERQVESYRMGRVLLAGDAAHVHSPAGGQGMNTGLQDAANLAWKLAAVVNGWAPEGLLDTYHAERHPVGRAVLRGSGGLLRVALARTPVTRSAQWFLANVVGRLGPLPGRASYAVSGLGIRYPPAAGQHSAVGRRAPDVRLPGRGDEPRRLYELLREGRFVLLTRPAVPLAEGPTEHVVTACADGLPAAAVLVRPDGYVAWATDHDAPVAPADALEQALSSPSRARAGQSAAPMLRRRSSAPGLCSGRVGSVGTYDDAKAHLSQAEPG